MAGDIHVSRGHLCSLATPSCLCGQRTTAMSRHRPERAQVGSVAGATEGG